MYASDVSSQRSIPLSTRPLTEGHASELASVFGALSDPVRLRLFDLVRRAGTDGICSCDLVEPLDRSQPTISHHLRVLREAGLVESRKEGTWVWYSATTHAMDTVARFVTR
jgi:ArsR family transcriptional regulator, arsenate/arsenite/antimonite-responsive transcriptional repressor